MRLWAFILPSFRPFTFPFWTHNERIIPAVANHWLAPTQSQQKRLLKENERTHGLHTGSEHKRWFLCARERLCFSLPVYPGPALCCEKSISQRLMRNSPPKKCLCWLLVCYGILVLATRLSAKSRRNKHSGKDILELNVRYLPLEMAVSVVW